MSSKAPKPSLRERLKPLELIGLSGVLGAFAGLVVLFATRNLPMAAVFFGVAFIVSLVTIATFALTFKPNDSEIADLHEQNEGGRGHDL